MPFLKLGAIYTLMYSQWKTNFKVYAFILWGNPVTPKIHALNLGAKQLTTVDRAKLVHTISRLSRVPNASVYNGRLLYRIFTTYLKPQVAKCYRTYFHSFVTGASLLNYGLNKKEDFNEQDLKMYNPYMYNQAKADYLIKLLDMYTRKGLDLKHIRDTLAHIQVAPAPPTSPATQVPSQTIPDQPAATGTAKPEGPTEPTEPEGGGGGTPPAAPGGNDELGGMGY